MSSHPHASLLPYTNAKKDHMLCSQTLMISITDFSTSCGLTGVHGSNRDSTLHKKNNQKLDLQYAVAMEVYGGKKNGLVERTNFYFSCNDFFSYLSF